MTTTRHAEVRCQQRGFPPLVVDLLLMFGQRERAAGGAWKCYLDKQSRRKVLAYAGRTASALEPYLDAYAVLSDDERVITVGHRTERIRHY